MERMADAYRQYVDPDFESDELKGTVNDLVMGTQSRDYTEPKSAEQRANQCTESFYRPHTRSHLRGPRKGQTRVLEVVPRNG